MRVLFTTQPGHGHLQPMAPYAQALVEAGDEVRVATAASFCQAVERLGLEAVPAGPDFVWERAAKSFPTLREAHRKGDIREVVRQIVWDHWVPQAIADLRPFVDEWRPDLVVREAAEHAGTFVARLAGIPTAVAAWGAVLTDPAWELAVIPDSVARRCWNRQAERLGLPSDVDAYWASELTLSCLPPSWISDDLEQVPPVHHFRMPPLDGGSAVSDWQRPGGGRPLVYATLGTVHGFDRELRAIMLEALAGVEADALMTVGRGADLRGTTPPDNVWIEEYVPQSLVLPHASAVVSHAGLGTMIGAIAAGVPMVLIDMGADHPINGGRAAALGVAELLKRDGLDPAALRDAVERMLHDPLPTTRAAALADEYARLPPPSKAVALLRDHAGAVEPSP